jgi:hypothetical protein
MREIWGDFQVASKKRKSVVDGTLSRIPEGGAALRDATGWWMRRRFPWPAGPEGRVVVRGNNINHSDGGAHEAGLIEDTVLDGMLTWCGRVERELGRSRTI